MTRWFELGSGRGHVPWLWARSERAGGNHSVRLSHMGCLSLSVSPRFHSLQKINGKLSSAEDSQQQKSSYKHASPCAAGRGTGAAPDPGVPAPQAEWPRAGRRQDERPERRRESFPVSWKPSPRVFKDWAKVILCHFMATSFFFGLIVGQTSQILENSQTTILAAA